MPPVILEGDTLGEKRRHFNKLVADAIADKHYELCNIRSDDSDIDNLLKIDIACKTRNVDYIMEVMKSTDMLYAATAIKKSTWLITEQQYAHIINPEYLHTQLLPSMNPKSFNKLMLHIRLNLKDETRVETFYEYLKETDIESNFNESVLNLKNTLSLLKDWKKDIRQYPFILEKIQELIKIKQDNKWKTDLSCLYNMNKSWRKHMFEESLSLSLCEETCLNALKHKPQLLARHDKEIDALRADDAVSLRRLLARLRVYWPHSLAQHWTHAYLLNLNKPSGQKAAIKGLFILLTQNQIIDVPITIPPMTLEGDTLGEKRRHFNKLVGDAIADKHYELCNIRADDSDLDNLLKIDIACKTRNVDYIMEVMKSTDMLYAATAIKKSTWLITEQQYAHIINPEYLHTQLLPSMNPKSFNKLMLHIRLNLKDETRVETFYEYLKGQENAYKWLQNCSIPFTKNVIQNERLIPLSLFKHWKKDIRKYPFILEKIQELIKIKQDNKWKTDLSCLYNMKKSWRKHMFEESLSLSLCEETCLNALKHKPQLLVRHDKEIDALRADDAVSLRRLLAGLRVYWPHSLAQHWTQAYLINLSILARQKASIKGLFILLPQNQVNDMAIKYAPDDFKINRGEIDQADLSIQKYIAQNLHLARPLVSLDTVLLYAKGNHLQYAVPSLDSILNNMSEIHITMPPLTLEGDTLGEKRRHFNKLVGDAIADKHYELCNIRADDSDVDNLLKIDIACKTRNVDYIMEVIKSTDMLYAATAIKKSTWLITEQQYAHIINPEYLHTQLLPSMNPKSFNKLMLHIRLNLKDETRNALSLLKDWKKDIRQHPFILEKIQELIKIKQDNKWLTDLSCLYNMKKSWRKHMFEESLSLSLCEETCLNALKHKPQLLARHDKEIDALRADDAVSLRRLLARLRVYWPHSLAQQWTHAYLINLSILARQKASIKGLFMLLPQNQINDMAIKYAPDDFKINRSEIDQADLNIQKYIAQNVHLARPLVSLETVLLYAKGNHLKYAVPSLNAILDNMSEILITMPPLTLEGDTLGEKHRHFNKLVADAIADKHELCNIRADDSDIDNLLKIDIACKTRNVDYIMEVMKSTDMLYAATAIKKSTWLITEQQYAHIINPEYLHTQLLPSMNPKSFNKLMLHIRLNLKDETRVETFYEYLKDTEVILEEIQKFVQIVHKNTWDVSLTYLYNINKPWRKHMFEESLSLSLCEETCLNALKHKPQLLARHDKEIDALRADDAVSLRRLLARLRVYWPHSLAQQWTDAYLLKHQTGQAVLKVSRLYVVKL
ncbi:hypothetical protein PYW07_008541 [Mythimna separata]|uniref:Uncharacterized protein n=1 Tax=Mythimna separata TaxID=271217 RepID=A0AAD7YCV8_MYTSE|nr:hypothetical protein PYW07_008541 [Mythimna separata]